MKYETKNNIGIILLAVGTLCLVGVLILSPLTTIFSWLLLLVCIVAIGYGFYLMTRGFTKVDIDHPDYRE